MYKRQNSNSSQLYNNCDILTLNLDVFPTLCLSDTGAVHGSYAASWIKNLGQTITHTASTICSPINNACVNVSESVRICLTIHDNCNLKSYKISIDVKILVSLDSKPYQIIIGLPDIKRYALLDKFANQFIDDALIDVGGLLQSDMGPTTSSTRNRPSNDVVVHNVDDNHTNPHSQLNLLHQSYEEDEEVTQYEYWDDVWSKNGVGVIDAKHDILNSIAKNIMSKNTVESRRPRGTLPRCRLRMMSWLM